MMTQDFLEDAVDLLKKEGFSYLIVIQPPSGGSALVKSDLDGWKSGVPSKTIKEDIQQLLDVTAFDN